MPSEAPSHQQFSYYFLVPPVFLFPAPLLSMKPDFLVFLSGGHGGREVSSSLFTAGFRSMLSFETDAIEYTAPCPFCGCHLQSFPLLSHPLLHSRDILVTVPLINLVHFYIHLANPPIILASHFLFLFSSLPGLLCHSISWSSPRTYHD